MRIYPPSLVQLNVSEIFQCIHGSSFSKDFYLTIAPSENTTLKGELRRYDFKSNQRRGGLEIINHAPMMPPEILDISKYLSFNHLEIKLALPADAEFKKPRIEIPSLYLGYLAIQDENVTKIPLAMLLFTSFI